LTKIAISYMLIADRYMKLGEKLRYLREVEGALRGLGREMTQQEVVRAMRAELGRGVSQGYLSQIEGGVRPHMTNSTRMLVAAFFKVHPGYLVDDPEGFHTELLSDVRGLEDRLDLWLLEGADRFRKDPPVAEALRKLALHEDSRSCLILLEEILDTPGLGDRLLQVLRPRHAGRTRGGETTA
jgi:transcriptional regulator with XRE-family HTH domain